MGALTHGAHDAIQDLSRIMRSAARLTGHIAASDRATDPEEEIAHMRANLDHLATLIEASGGS